MYKNDYLLNQSTTTCFVRSKIIDTMWIESYNIINYLTQR